MDKARGKKLLLRVLMIVVIGAGASYLFFFVILPSIIIGGPTPLYYITNHDTRNHTIGITIVDSSNKTILSQTYNIQPDTHVRYERGFGWYPTITWTPFTWSEGNYTFIAVLDGNSTVSHSTDVQFTQTIWIEIQKHGSPRLEIREVWVL